MATRASMNDHIDRAEKALEYANEQLNIWNRQEHYNQTEYTKAQQFLEDAHNDLEHIMLSANDQQRERLFRMTTQLRQVQNDMVLIEEDLQQRS